MEMETRAKEAIGIGEDITSPLPPLSFALHDYFLPTFCSACFTSIATAGTSRRTSPFVVYCSEKCASIDSTLHFSSAEHHLFLHLRHHPSSWPHGDTTDLRASLRLLRHLELLNLLPTPSLPLPGRIAGLMTNHERLSSIEDDEECLARIKDGARAMAMARAMRDGSEEFDGDCVLEEALMCIVLTNAVEVQIGQQRALGIAVYDGRFSWINHSCSPNSCYRFDICSENVESSDSVIFRIGPAFHVNQMGMEDDSVNSMYELAEGCTSNGPRLIVRSIKRMKERDQVTVTYTDLRQPTVVRRSDLWFKYQFLCSCIRCNAVPISYVDQALQETYDVNPSLTYSRGTRSVNRDSVVEETRDYFDSIISQFMSDRDTKSCCEKIENLLIGKHLTKLSYLKKHSVMDFRLSPINHLSLSSYTSLSCGYSILSSLMENASRSFNMRRISTAYSLLLAGATHHLFITEPSLIASAANFWIDAGKSLILCVRRSFLQSHIKESSPTNNYFLSSLVCESCLLMGMFEGNFSRVPECDELNTVSEHFFNCMISITPKVWNFLSRDCCYISEIEDPIDFSWLEPLRSSNVWEFTSKILPSGLYSTQRFDGSSTRNSKDGQFKEVSSNLLLLGAHCLIYGWYLCSVCYGEDSPAANCARQTLYM